MPKTSAGLLLFRKKNSKLEVFLIHPGGPFFKTKDAGAWSIPKGEINEGEDPLAAARREFEEETGCRVEGEFLSLLPVKQKSGKIIVSWAVEGDCDADAIRSNTFTVEWPRNSGRIEEFPEADKAAWLSMEEARTRIIAAQTPLLDELLGLQGSDESR